MLRVLHLVGSPVDQTYADLSLLYARDCLASTADPSRYEPVLAYVEPGGRWRFPTGLDDAALAAATPMPLPAALALIDQLHVDVAVPQLFCRPGMTTYRAVLDAVGLPFVGNPADVMALGADKARCKAVVAGAGVDVPPGEVVRPGSPVSVPPPAVVKPADADNSFGVTLVRDPADYAAALAAAYEHSSAALVEMYVPLGREVRCGVLERDGELLCLPLEEYAVDAEHKPVRDAADKLRRSGSGPELVAKDAAHAWIVDPADPSTASVWAAARRAHQALGCRDYSLFDFRIDRAGRPWFLEAGLYCSFARQSVIAVMAAAAGITLPELFDAGLQAALDRALIPR